MDVWPQAAPVAFAVAAWWCGTAAIHWLAMRPRRTHPWSMVAATLAMLLALGLLGALRPAQGAAAAYVAFALAIVVWGWQELAFLLGYVTGPRRVPCPAGLSPWRRAALAVQTLLHHELALLLLAALLLALQPGSRVALWVFVALWIMRLSAKLNLFLGVRHTGEQLLPLHLAYLGSYFGHQPFNPLLPLSLLLGGVACAALWHAGLGAPDAHEATALRLTAALVALGTLEHAFFAWNPGRIRSA